MKRILLLLIANMLTTLTMSAQADSNFDNATQTAYRPFIEDGKVWKVGAVNSGNPVQWVEYYYFDGDTVIGGKTCKQMICRRFVSPDYPEYDATPQLLSQSCAGAWYEADKKVYQYDTTNGQFLLKYDFSLDDYDTLQISHQRYVIGPRKTGGTPGFKGVYREVENNMSYKTTWMEGVGSIYGPTINIIDRELADSATFLMSCTVGDDVIYLNEEYKAGATPAISNAPKQRIDFTHTVKTKPKAPMKRAAGLPLHGEYTNTQLAINLAPIDNVYLLRITNETGKLFYARTINTGVIVALDIDISAYPKGHYIVSIDNSYESFTGQFDTQTTGIEVVKSKTSEPGDAIYNLQGQRISSLQKGLNIVNGRKVHVK